MATNYNITSNNAGYGPLFTRQDVTNQSPKEMRYVRQSEVFSRPGVTGGMDFKVSYSSSFTLSVKAGTAHVAATSQGYYTQVMPVDATVTLDTNSTASTRIDRIFLAISDRDNSGTAEEAVIYVITGTAGAGVPATTTMTNTYKATLELAQVSIPANTTTNLSAATITDLRTFVPVNSLIPTTSSNRPSATSTWPTNAAYTGLGVYETDTKSLRFFDGTNWVPSGIRYYNGTTAIAGSNSNISTSQILMQSGSNTGTTDANGFFTANFPSAFPNGIMSVVVTSGDTYLGDVTSGLEPVMAGINSYTLSQFIVECYRLYGPVNGFNVAVMDKYATGPIRVNWIAIGW